MSKSGGNFNEAKAKEQSDKIQEQIKKMQQEHEQLLQSCDENQRQAWQASVRNINRLREQVDAHHVQMNRELTQTTPNGKIVAEHAQEMERVMTEWQKQYRTMLEQTD